jgi:hypothetical protein
MMGSQRCPALSAPTSVVSLSTSCIEVTIASPVFLRPCDYDCYLTQLREAALRQVVAIHAYVLMTNHVHLLATPRDTGGISRMMQHLGRRFVPYICSKGVRAIFLMCHQAEATPVSDSVPGKMTLTPFLCSRYAWPNCSSAWNPLRAIANRSQTRRFSSSWSGNK